MVRKRNMMGPNVRSGWGLASLLLSNCATYRPTASIHSFGDFDPARDRALSEAAEDRSVDVSGVRVVVGSPPDGLELADNGFKLIVKDGYQSAYQVLGTVHVAYLRDLENAIVRNLFWTWNYEQSWRKVLCYPQVPLKILTLGIWYIVPTEYPCLAVVPSNEHDREADLVTALRRGAKVMGGNLVFLSRLNGANVDVISTSFAYSTVRSNMAASGFVLKANLGRRAQPTRTVPSASGAILASTE